MDNPVPSATDVIPPLRDETTRFARFVAGSDDIDGMLAHALHIRAFAAFRARFAAETGRVPAEADEAAFLIGETDPIRIAWYRDEAARMLAARVATTMSGKSAQPDPGRSSWPHFGLLPEAARTAAEAGGVNWKGLLVRLVVLLLAVITTALLLRVLVVGK